MPLPKLKLLVDVVFRRLFTDPPLLISLLNALLHLRDERRITQLTITQTQVQGPLADDKEVVFDIRAVAQSGKQYHIEVQVRAFVSYAERMLFYWSGAYQGQLQAGKRYKELQPVISVHILDFRLLPRKKRFRRYHHIFEVRDRRTGYRLTRHLQMHTLEMPKFVKQLGQMSTDEQKWVYFLRHGHAMDAAQIAALAVPEIVKAEEKLRVISQDRQLRIDYERRVLAQMDAASPWKDKNYKEGRKEGKREGKIELLQQMITKLCRNFGVELTAAREAELTKLRLPALEQLCDHLLTHQAWPES